MLASGLGLTRQVASLVGVGVGGGAGLIIAHNILNAKSRFCMES